MRAVRRLALGCVAFAAAACAVPITLPAEFVQLRDAGDGYRAVTSDGARVWVRELWDPTDAGAEFWADSVRADLVGRRGYELVDEGEVQSGDGDAGRWLELIGDVGGRRVGYLVACWPHDKWLRSGKYLQVVEFAAEAEVYAARVDAVRAALGTVRW